MRTIIGDTIGVWFARFDELFDDTRILIDFSCFQIDQCDLVAKSIVHQLARGSGFAKWNISKDATLSCLLTKDPTQVLYNRTIYIACKRIDANILQISYCIDNDLKWYSKTLGVDGLFLEFPRRFYDNIEANIDDLFNVKTKLMKFQPHDKWNCIEYTPSFFIADMKCAMAGAYTIDR